MSVTTGVWPLALHPHLPLLRGCGASQGSQAPPAWRLGLDVWILLMDLLSPPAWPTGAPWPKPHLPKGKPHLPPHQTTTTHTQSFGQHCSKPPQAHGGCTTTGHFSKPHRAPASSKEPAAKPPAKHLSPDQEWDHLVLRAPRGPQPIRQLPCVSPCPHRATRSWIHGTWPTCLGMVPELVTPTSPVPPNRMSFRTQDLLLFVVLAFLCACMKGLQGLPFPGCLSKVECRTPNITRSN